MISLQTEVPLIESLTSGLISATEVKKSGEPIQDLVAACATWDPDQLKFNLWAILTSDNSVIDAQYAIETVGILSCKGVNTVSDGTVYVVMENPEGLLNLLTVDVINKESSVRIQSNKDFIQFEPNVANLLFI